MGVHRNGLPRLKPIVGWLWRPIDSSYEQAGFIFVLFWAIAFRIPKVWIEGRFWAKEGTVFFAKAWSTPWWDALLATHAGYLNITVNTIALAAVHLTQLEYAPYVTTVIATFIQCLPVVMLLLAKQEWLTSRFVILAACFVIVFVPVSDEVWAKVGGVRWSGM